MVKTLERTRDNCSTTHVYIRRFMLIICYYIARWHISLVFFNWKCQINNMKMCIKYFQYNPRFIIPFTIHNALQYITMDQSVLERFVNFLKNSSLELFNIWII